MSSYIINCVIFIRYIHHTSFHPTSKDVICYILAIISVILQVTFEGITGRSSKGDIAIDDFSLNLGPCPSSKHFPVIVWNILQKQRVFKKKVLSLPLIKNSFSSTVYFQSAFFLTNNTA